MGKLLSYYVRKFLSDERTIVNCLDEKKKCEKNAASVLLCNLNLPEEKCLYLYVQKWKNETMSQTAYPTSAFYHKYFSVFLLLKIDALDWQRTIFFHILNSEFLVLFEAPQLFLSDLSIQIPVKLIKKKKKLV